MHAKIYQTAGPRGFALVVTLSLMILLTVIAVGLLSLSSISLRSTNNQGAQGTARANAKLAMMLALGQLQKAAGRDQNITGPATLGQSGTGTIVHPAWTGVWKSDDKTAAPIWLVSGESSNPATALDKSNSALLSNKSKTPEPDSAAAADLRAAWVNVEGRQKGRYAYWVGDEGAKAKVDVTRPATTASNDRERRVRSQSPLEPGMFSLDEQVWANFDPKNTSTGLDKRKLASMGTVALAATPSAAIPRDELPRHHLHDLTTGGYGLPVNVKDGGMKVDLSLVLDRSQQSATFMRKFLGATPFKNDLNGATFYEFAVSDASRFYLSDSIRDNVPEGVGPNWGNLLNYAMLWQNLSSNQMPVVGIHPRLDSDLVQTMWQPYKKHNNGLAYASDTQHTNSGLSPVVSMIQMGFYLGASGPFDKKLADGSTVKRYEAELHIRPVIGLWNPYNVPLRSSVFQVDWAMLPFMRFDFQKPVGNTFPNGSGNVTEIWMRDHWLNDKNSSPTGSIPSGGAQGGGYIQLTIDADFQPGEFRLFSVEANPILGKVNKLVPKLDFKGTYTMKILRSTAKGTDPLDQVGKPLLIPEGFYGWFGDVYLQDTHWNNDISGSSISTRQHLQTRYGMPLDPNAATSWFTLKAKGGGGDTHLQRFTNLWNGGQDEKSKMPFIPEPIVTARDRLTVSGASGKTPHLISSLVNNRGHVGTWRFYLRNPTEIEDANQGLRGWIDSNPRVLASNLRFDGSKSFGRTTASAGTREGWNAASNLIAGAHRSGAKRGDVGDGAGGDRGLVAEGQGATSVNVIPEGVPTPGRWQGYGGGGSAADTGLTHVIAYDVPRAPLTSVGQFQHAELARYNYEPGFVVGNSYANPRIPLNSTTSSKLGFEINDISYDVNGKLWDSVFFSTLAPDYKSTSTQPSTFAKSFDYKAVVAGTSLLANPRMIYQSQTQDTSFDQIISAAGDRAPQAMASRILIDGGFNVNSTSKTAWKAILSTMGGSELPVIDPTKPGSNASWQTPDGIRFNRFGTSILNDSYSKGDGLSAASFWQGWRSLASDELDALAGEIVKEVKARGPFRTFAEFVNRDPASPNVEHQRKGALQAALDRVANNSSSIPIEMAKPATNPMGADFSQAVNGENQAVGHASYLLQGDVLQSLAPILQVRSDYFRIRTCGEALDASGKVMATAYCEAFVQRTPEYTDYADKPEVAHAELGSQVNRSFGRRFKLVSFRWLSSSEI